MWSVVAESPLCGKVAVATPCDADTVAVVTVVTVTNVGMPISTPLCGVELE